MLAKLTAAIIAFGPWGVFLLALMDSAGLPIVAGADLVILLIGVKAPQRAYFAAIMALVGSFGGNLALFLAARHGSRRFLGRPVAPSEQKGFRRWFQNYGLATVFVPAMVPVAPLPLKVFVISAGVLHTPISHFASVILVARSIRYFGQAYLAIRLRNDAPAFLMRNAWKFTIATFAFAIALYLLIHWINRRRGPPHRWTSEKASAASMQRSP